MIPKQSKLGNWKHNCSRNSTNNAKKKETAPTYLQIIQIAVYGSQQFHEAFIQNFRGFKII